MKILHSSDWHLGQEFYSYDRTEEHTSFLNQIRQIVADEQPDAMVVSGDIYHTAAPSNTTMRLFTDHLLKIQEACPFMKIIVTAGNHDSSSRLEITRNLWERVNVEMIGRINRYNDTIDFDRHIISINGKDNRPTGIIVAIPHVFPQSFPLVSEDTPREKRQSAFWAALNNRLNEINTEKLPVVLMVHMAISGSDITGHDESRGGMDYVDIDSIPVDYDYMALGHIHCPQLINGAGTRARYCGTPIPVSFDENYEHSVSLVEITSGAEPTVRTIKINNPIPLKTIPEEAAPYTDVLKELATIDSCAKMYVRLNIRLDNNVPKQIREQAIDSLRDKQARFCTIKWEREPTATDKNQPIHITTDDMLTASPLEIAKLHFKRLYDTDMGQDMIDMLNEVISAVVNPNS